MASEYGSTTAFLQSVTSDALTQASNNASRIWGLENTTASTRDPSLSIIVNKPDIGAPPTLGDLIGGDSTDPTIQYLNEQSEAWLEKYFPAINGCFKNQPEETLCAILAGTKPFGLDKTVLDMVWNQARDRAYRTKESERRTVEAQFSSRGFTLPAGALVDVLTQIEQNAADAALNVSREQAIKDADIKVDIFKLGLQLSTQLKTAILSTLAEFYRMWVTVPDKDIERARIRAQAQASLYAALASYYNVEIAFEELRVKAQQAGAEVDLGVDRNALTKQANYMGIAPSLATATSAFANTAANAAQAGGSLTAQVESL